jgi:uncharacterized membrane protein YdfJ with MMPL/SSD domain
VSKTDWLHSRQHLLDVELYWVILPLAVILLLAVGSDYTIPQKFGDHNTRQLSLFKIPDDRQVQLRL